LKEPPELFAALRGKNPPDDIAAMVQSRISRNRAERGDVPRLRVGAAIDDFRDPGIHARSGAHRARLHRHVKDAPLEPPRPDPAGRAPDRLNLGMGDRVKLCFPLVAPDAHDLAVSHDDRSDGNFTPPAGKSRESQGVPHRIVVLIHRTPIAFSRAMDFKKRLRFAMERARFRRFSMESYLRRSAKRGESVKKSRSGIRGGVKGKEGYSWPKR
jgi:hypothetical protein